MVGEKGAVTPRALVVGIVAALVVVVGVAAFLLRGNGSDGAAPVGTPTSPASTSASATVSPSPSPTESAVVAPVLPDAATKPTRAGAVAFVRHFFDVYDYSYAVLDAEPLEALSEQQCRYCRAVLDDIAEQRRLRHRFVDGQTEVTEAVAPPGDPEAGVVVNALVRQSAGTTLDETGAIVDSSPALPEKRVDAKVTWSAGRWLMTGVQVKTS